MRQSSLSRKDFMRHLLSIARNAARMSANASGMAEEVRYIPSEPLGINQLFYDFECIQSEIKNLMTELNRKPNES
jgi:hypothetical protein